ncbi:MAG: hypothetical protein EPO08_19245 [Rhodospirillaceae bacterium]|nr:MAG: hypothetical protein EPO08_19245 [Rhodospirillaceae bacterium]
MEVIRNSRADRPLIQRYRGGGFTVSGGRYVGPVVVLPTETIFWPVADIAAIDGAWLASILVPARVSLCIIGCGARMAPVPAALRQILKEAGIGTDSMETGAACRTYNMLTAEGRAVAAALIPLA